MMNWSSFPVKTNWRRQLVNFQSEYILSLLQRRLESTSFNGSPPFQHQITHLRRMSKALPSTSLTATVVFLLLFPPEAAAAAEAAAAEPDMPMTPAPLVLFVMPLCFACSLKGPLNIALR